MSYTVCNVVGLGPAYTGVTLNAQLYDSGNNPVGGAIITGFSEEAGSLGIYKFALTVPDGHQGWCSIYVNGAPSVILATLPINPAELEYFVGSIPVNAVQFTYTLTDSVTTLPIAGALVWFSSDVTGQNIVWMGSTNALGVAVDNYGNLPLLQVGPIYVWASKSGYQFANPDLEEVFS